ncbi:hypothetical protein M3Y99_01594000 [Aphelenchoides fujianensis]|nr:hypothetical protein M3Y99_01594000 [Aphelenchoides fujianensis]
MLASRLLYALVICCLLIVLLAPTAAQPAQPRMLLPMTSAVDSADRPSGLKALLLLPRFRRRMLLWRRRRSEGAEDEEEFDDEDKPRPLRFG